MVQLINLCKGRTTCERYGFRAKSIKKATEENIKSLEEPIIVGSTLTSETRAYYLLEEKYWTQNIIDMLFRNNYHKDYNLKKEEVEAPIAK